MASYNKILMALDFHGDNDQIINKGLELVESNNAELFLIHINEPLAAAYAADGMSWGGEIVSLEVNIRKESQVKMSEAGNLLKVDSEHCLLRDGKPAHEIHETVKELGIDLIVMGTHGQSGLQLLLGSTASSVLHGSTCDVLTVRIRD
ncbi:MAG: universal stress protein [Pseudomonadales bacterium]|jgi:universal stress protein A